MNKRELYNYSPLDSLNEIKDKLLDPYARELTKHVKWTMINGLSKGKTDLYPIAILGSGPPIILIHGFDSCFLEYRRLVPYLKKKNKLIIPDLYGFGFTPRHADSKYGLEMIIYQLNKIMDLFPKNQKFGLIGASMGGGIGMELARRNNSKINKLLLLSPAGLLGKAKKVPRPLDTLGVMFLKNRFVRKLLCQRSFADSSKSVGAKEEQIASIHLGVPGWGSSLAAFARSGGISNCGLPQPKQPTTIIWGKDDRILDKSEIDNSKRVLNCMHIDLNKCGHLPHLDQPELVYKNWL